MKLHPKKKAVLDIYGREPRDLDDLGHCVIAVLNSQYASNSIRPNKNTKRIKVAGLMWEIEHQASVSNTHDAPLNGVTNWGGRKPGAPHGYPGWYGRA